MAVNGDLKIDSHHPVDDTGIVLGSAIRDAVGDGSDIRRFSHAIIPVDESRATVALDAGGRGYLVMDDAFTGTVTGEFPTICLNISSTASVSMQGLRRT